MSNDLKHIRKKALEDIYKDKDFVDKLINLIQLSILDSDSTSEDSISFLNAMELSNFNEVKPEKIDKYILKVKLSYLNKLYLDKKISKSTYHSLLDYCFESFIESFVETKINNQLSKFEDYIDKIFLESITSDNFSIQPFLIN